MVTPLHQSGDLFKRPPQETKKDLPSAESDFNNHVVLGENKSTILANFSRKWEQRSIDKVNNIIKIWQEFYTKLSSLLDEGQVSVKNATKILKDFEKKYITLDSMRVYVEDVDLILGTFTLDERKASNSHVFFDRLKANRDSLVEIIKELEISKKKLTIN